MKNFIIIGFLIPVLFACSMDDSIDGNVDFSYDEYVGGFITSEHGQNKINEIKTREELIKFYADFVPYYDYGYSSMSADDKYICMKLEYLLAQECAQRNCDSQTRKNILKLAIEKQKQKFGEYRDAFGARRTGEFLIAVILFVEQDASFMKVLEKNADLKGALHLNIDMRVDLEFSDLLIQFAENYLK